MALIKCPHCGKPVSDRAVKCPHCGNGLGKATIIQHDNGADSLSLGTIGKVIFAIATLGGSVMCILPLFTNLYERGWAPAFGYYLPITYVLVGFGILAGALSFGLTVYGIVRLCMNKASTWRFWLLSTIFAWLSVIAVFSLIVYNVDTYYDVRNDKQKEKLEAAEGTYECRLEDGTTIYFSITYDGNGFFECKYPYGASRIGYCDITYEFEYGEYCFEVWLPEDSFDGTKLTKSSHAFFMYDYDKLESMYVDSKLYPLKKISNKAKTKEQYVVEVEEAKRAKFEENKNFRSNDLSAFMLHGKVRMMIETYNSSSYISTYTFDEKGQLTEAKEGDDYMEISHEGGNILILSCHKDKHEYINGIEYVDFGFEYTYEIDKSNRLSCFSYGVYYSDVGYTETYSSFDSNGWPASATNDDMYDTTYIQFQYSDIDEYGNWTKKKNEGKYSNGEAADKNIVYREITYYPADI